MTGKSADKRFTKDHEWVLLDGDIATVGITDYAQEQLGDLVHIELPELERAVAEGEACAVAESVWRLWQFPNADTSTTAA